MSLNKLVYFHIKDSMKKNFLKNIVREIYYSAKPQICMDVIAWAKKNGLDAIETYPPVLCEVEPYVIGDPLAKSHFDIHYDVLCRPQALVIIKNAIIKDADGLVQLPDGQVCYEGNWHLPYLLENPAYRRYFARKRYLKGNIYSLLSLWSKEFYHWFYDVLPRLEFVLPHLPNDTKFLIQENPHNYQLESLQAYGIDLNRLEIQSNGLDTKVERLWFANPIGVTGMSAAYPLQVVSNRLKRFFKIKDVGIKKHRIYISRKLASCRRVVNELVLEPLLNEFRFDIIYCEHLSLVEQIQLFANAEAIVSPHGAGMIHMIFAPNNISIAEISPFSASIPPCYAILAKQLGHKFTRLDADLSSDLTLFDMNLEPAKLCDWIKSLS